MMQAFLHRARFLCYVLAVAILNLSILQTPLRAELIATDSAMASPATGDSPRARVMAALERADVQAELAAYGVDPNEAMIRVESLTDSEVARLADRVDALPAGRGGWCDNCGNQAASAAGVYIGVFIAVILLVALIVWLISKAVKSNKDATVDAPAS